MVVGIDAGTHTGIAIFENQKLARMYSTNTYEAIVFLQECAYKIKKVIIEDSAKQSYIWNKNNKTGGALGRHARNIGSVDGSVRVFKEACEALKIGIIAISPLQKGKKWTHAEFVHYFPYYKGQTNQHERDAAKCVVSQRYEI